MSALEESLEFQGLPEWTDYKDSFAYQIGQDHE